MKRNEEIWELYKKGIDANIIAQQFGISRRAVYYVIAKYTAKENYAQQ